MEEVYERILAALPEQAAACLRLLDGTQRRAVTEVRLRAGAPASVTLGGGNRYMTAAGPRRSGEAALVFTEADLKAFLYRFCGGSVYAHERTLAKGYLTVRGVRVGVAGSFGEKGVEKIGSLCIRLPRHVEGCAAALVSAARRDGCLRGVLVASAPGVGKTTVLRDFARTLASGEDARRVVLIDEREELFLPEVFAGCLIDVVAGVDKAAGLTNAVRALAPEAAVFDEIVSEAEARSLAAAHAGGVAIYASVHETSAEAILAKPSLAALFAAGVFGGVYLLSKDADGKRTGRYADVGGGR